MIENVLPTRLTLVAVPALGALLALGTEELRRRVAGAAAHRGAGIVTAVAAAGLVLLPVVAAGLLAYGVYLVVCALEGHYPRL